MEPLNTAQLSPYLDVEYERRVSIEFFPEEILAKIFSHLTTLGDQASCTLSCRRWNSVIHDPTLSFVKRKENLQMLEEKGRYVGPSTLNRLFEEKGKFPPIPEEIFRQLESPCPENKGKQKKETHILFLMPKTINGTPLTINFIDELAKNKNGENKIGCRFICDMIKKEYCKKALEESSWVLMTEDVLKGSRGKSREVQLKMASMHGEGYRAPTLLEAVYINIILYMDRGERLFSGESLTTYTCCQEKIVERWKLAVGGFSHRGLSVLSVDDHILVGVAALLKLR